MDWFSDPNAWIALASLTALEIVLGIDNIVFISVLAQRLPVEHQARVRMIGLTLAMVGRIVLLLGISWVMGLTKELFSVAGLALSGKDLILVFGGLFLLAKGTREIHHTMEGGPDHTEAKGTVSVRSVLTQIVLLDVVFSLDSVITAVGMVKHISVMILAVVIAVSVMLLAAGRVSAFIGKHPTVKMLALAFLILVGVTLLADGLHFHVPKGYIYFAMGFSLFVEFLNLRASARRKAKAAARGAAPAA
ncbi:MAG: TerC family protein [Planctomycetes bacterium]|jgi:predicted tellurium resistance membrane protein TerC|nr:TerC family protein [Planctomycetota bacterium]